MKVTKTTKPKKTINEAVDFLENKEKRIVEVQTAFMNPNYSKMVDFMMRFGGSKDCEMIIQVLNRLQEHSQTFRRKDEFNTLYEVAMIDGERALLTKFTQLMLDAIQGDRMTIENKLNRNI